MKRINSDDYIEYEPVVPKEVKKAFKRLDKSFLIGLGKHIKPPREDWLF